MEMAVRPFLGVLFGVFGILVWIVGMVVLSWFIENKVDEDRQV